MLRLDLLIPRIVEFRHVLSDPSGLNVALDRLAEENLHLVIGSNAGRLHGVLGADAIRQTINRGVRTLIMQFILIGFADRRFAAQTTGQGRVDPDALNKDLRLSLAMAEDQMSNASKFIIESSEHVMNVKEYTRLALKAVHSEIRQLVSTLDEEETGFSYVAYGWTQPLWLWLQPGLRGKGEAVRGAAQLLHELVALLQDGVLVVVEVRPVVFLTTSL